MAQQDFSDFVNPFENERQPARQPGWDRDSEYAAPEDYQPILAEAAKANGIPVSALMAVAHQESRFQPDAVGEQTEFGKAKGMFQITDGTAETWGVEDQFDVRESAFATARRMAERREQGYSWEETFKAHFAGDDRDWWGPSTNKYGQELMAKFTDLGGEAGAAGGADFDFSDFANPFESELERQVIPAHMRNDHLMAQDTLPPASEVPRKETDPAKVADGILGKLRQYSSHVGNTMVQGAAGMLSDTAKAIDIGINQPDQELLESYRQTANGGDVPLAKQPDLGPINRLKSILFHFKEPDEQQAIIADLEAESREARNGKIYQMAESFDQWVKDTVPNDDQLAQADGLQGFLVNDVPQGMGSMLGFVLASVATRGAAARLAPGMSGAQAAFTGAAVPGAMANYTNVFEESLEDGATLAEAYDAAGIAKYIGMAEGVPLAGFLQRADKASGGSLTKAVKDVVKQGTEEAIQEAGTEVANALARHAAYDPEQGIWEVAQDAGHSGAVGFTTGALLESFAKMLLPGRAPGMELGADELNQMAGQVASNRQDQRQAIGQDTETIYQPPTGPEQVNPRGNANDGLDASVPYNPAATDLTAQDQPEKTGGMRHLLGDFLANEEEEQSFSMDDEIRNLEDVVRRDQEEAAYQQRQQAEAQQRAVDPVAYETDRAQVPMEYAASRARRNRPALEERVTQQKYSPARQQPNRIMAEAMRPELERVDRELVAQATREEEQRVKRSEQGRKSYQKGRQVRPEQDDILVAISKLGRLNKQEARDQGFDLPEGDRDPVFSENGMSFDQMAEALTEEGYLQSSDGSYMANDLVAMVDRALRGERIHHPAAMDRIAAEQQEEWERQRLGAEAEAEPEAEVAAIDPDAWLDADEVLSPEEIERINAQAGQDIEIPGFEAKPKAKKAKAKPADDNAVPFEPKAAYNLDDAANEAATSPTNALAEPTEAQIEAGNYKKGKVKLQGLDISIENPRGSTRSGTDPDGKAWSNTMAHHYGYIRRTEGADGEQVDVFIGPDTDSERVFVVDQVNSDGSFDEHKILTGFSDKLKARQGYKANYTKDWKVGPITEMSMAEFKTWLKEADNTQPVDASLTARKVAKKKRRKADSVAQPKGEYSAKDYRPETFYHGTVADFDKFETDSRGAAFFAKDSSYANDYISPDMGETFDQGGRIIPVRLREGRFMQVDDGLSMDEQRKAIKKAKREGFDGIESPDYVAVFDPDNVASAISDGVREFAGPYSATADTHALDTAKQMLADGRPRELVRRETGWFQGADGKWRYEISDHDAKWKELPKLVGSWDAYMRDAIYEKYGVKSGHEGMVASDRVDADYYEWLDQLEEKFLKEKHPTLKNVLDHPKLFAAYPRLKHYSLTLMDLGPGGRGEFNERMREIRLAPMEPDQMMSTLLHEIQHAIQAIENWNRGGNTDREFIQSVKGALEQMDDSLVQQIEGWKTDHRAKISKANRMAQLARYALMYDSAQRLISYANHDRPSSVFRHIRNELQWLYAEGFRNNDQADQLQRDFYNIPRRHKMRERNAFLSDMAWRGAQLLLDTIPADIRKSLKNDQRTLRGLIKSLERQASRAREALKPLDELKADSRQAASLRDKYRYAGPFEVYQALAGEVEARNTQRRQQLTEEQRRDTSPETTADVASEETIVIVGGQQLQLPTRMANVSKPTRKELQAASKAWGFPANEPTDKLQARLDVIIREPSTWSAEDLALVAPYLSIHQDLRKGSTERVDGILRDGLKSGMVDSLDRMLSGEWTWAGGLKGGDAYLFPSRQLKYRSKTSPYLEPGNVPLIHFSNTAGQDILAAIQGGRRNPNRADRVEQDQLGFGFDGPLFDDNLGGKREKAKTSKASAGDGSANRPASGDPAPVSRRRGTEVRGSAKPQGFSKEGTAKLIGAKVKTAEQLAQAAQIYRNPQFETFRVFFTKGDKVVHQTGISSRIPGSSAIFPTGTPDGQGFALYAKMMQEAGADGYYLLHNHPSGDPTASRQDLRMTERFAQEVPGFRSHVIINSGKFNSLVLSDWGVSEQVRSFTPKLKTYDLTQHERPHPLLGANFTDARSAARLAKEAQQDKSALVVMVRGGGDSGLRGIMEIPMATLANKVKAYATLRRFARHVGGQEIIIAADIASHADASSFSPFVKQAIADDLLLDGIWLYEDGQHLSVRSATQQDPEPGMAFGRKQGAGTGFVHQPAGKTDSAAFKKWFGDSKVVDAKGEPLVVYHGTRHDFDAFDPGRKGAHFGSREQAVHRVEGVDGQQIMPAYLSIKNPKRVKDTNAWGRQIREAKDQGHDGIVYLNRVEGVDVDAMGGFSGQQLQLMSDSEFERRFGGTDSWIAFEPTQIKSATGNRGTFDPADPSIIREDQAPYGPGFPEPEAAPPPKPPRRPKRKARGDRPPTDFEESNRRFREEHKTAWYKAKMFWRRQFLPGGLLPKQAFELKIDRDNQIGAIEFDVGHLVGNLEATVERNYGMPFEQLNEQQQRDLQDTLTGNPPGHIPAQVMTAVAAMRQYIDSLSAEYASDLARDVEALRAEGSPEALEKASLLHTIQSNMGQYAHRSYRAFDNPNWYQEIPDDVLDAARDYLASRHLEDGHSRAEAQRLAELSMEEIVKVGTAYDSMEAMIKESKLGRKDLSLLQKRKEIAPEIRALLGEYVDPRINFAKSASKMGRLVWNSRFLEKLREAGDGVFLFEKDQRPTGATVRISAPSTEAYAPLDGLWTYPEVDQALKDALGKEQMADWYRKIVQLNGFIKYGKTVLSPTTAARNWQSAMFFAVANGHFDLRHARRSTQGLREYFTHKGGGAQLKYLRRLKELGVVYDTPYAGEMMRLLDDSKLEDIMASKSGTLYKKLRAFNQYATKAYQYGDDFWKIIGFENELGSLLRAGVEREKAEQMAAERIRNTYPTYSMTGRGIDWLRRFPLAGTFVSFPAEIIRTSANMVQTTAGDLQDPQLRTAGLRRLFGMATATASIYGLAAISKAMLGIDDEEEEAVRLLAAPWERNSNILFTGRNEQGQLQYIDLSFLDPYGYWKRPITAALRDQPWQDAMVQGIRELTTPFIGIDIGFGAVAEVAMNKSLSTGSPIYDAAADPQTQGEAIGRHLRRAVQPGFVSNIERTWKAAQGELKSSGQPYDLGDEGAAWIGWRFRTLEPKTALYYRSFGYGDAKSAAAGTLGKVLRDPNDISDKKIRDTYERANRQLQEEHRQMRLIVEASMKNGLTEQDVLEVLQRSTIGRDSIMALLRDIPLPLQVSEQSARSAVESARAVYGPDHANKIRDRYLKAVEIAGEKTQAVLEKHR